MSYKRKKYLWLPYLNSIDIKPKNVKFIYKGGEVQIDWVDIHSIMIYGDSCDLPADFIDKCAFYKIPIIFHRRNLARASIITPSLTSDSDDLLTKQIKFRENDKKRSYIAKKLILAKFKSMEWLINSAKDQLYKITDIQKMKNIEAWHAKRYWKEYFLSLGLDQKRRENNEIQKTLNAISKFVSSIILRWILYHNLSPYHGFLHNPTDYPSLVYDLIEPYRGYFDKVIFDLYKENQSIKNNNNLLPIAIEKIKELLNKQVYVHSTRQIATFQELLHGIVLSLRMYLNKKTRRFIVPQIDKPRGGRPINSGFKLYGHTAGITDFWTEAKKINLDFVKIQN
ncbi:MAG: hypothetical protein KatS3mg092_0779 [Patescibacteria group bacterium]|nr:MAG: hypothetical protein KatS3mg092_0779 [Patescibacteria group bacterium]